MHRTQPLFKGLKDVYLFEIETIKREYNGLPVSTPRQAHFYFRKAEESALPGCPALLGAEVCGQWSGSEKESRLWAI